jgi:hypothetical protein
MSRCGYPSYVDCTNGYVHDTYSVYVLNSCSIIVCGGPKYLDSHQSLVLGYHKLITIAIQETEFQSPLVVSTGLDKRR